MSTIKLGGSGGNMSKLTIVVTGANGQLGADMVTCLQDLNFDVYGLTRQELDITNMELVETVLGKINPDIVIHAAAYTKVDLAESEPEEAYRINSYGTRNIAVVSE